MGHRFQWLLREALVPGACYVKGCTYLSSCFWSRLLERLGRKRAWTRWTCLFPLFYLLLVFWSRLLEYKSIVDIFYVFNISRVLLLVRVPAVYEVLVASVS